MDIREVVKEAWLNYKPLFSCIFVGRYKAESETISKLLLLYHLNIFQYDEEEGIIIWYDWRGARLGTINDCNYDEYLIIKDLTEYEKPIEKEDNMKEIEMIEICPKCEGKGYNLMSVSFVVDYDYMKHTSYSNSVKCDVCDGMGGVKKIVKYEKINNMGQ